MAFMVWGLSKKPNRLNVNTAAIPASCPRLKLNSSMTNTISKVYSSISRNMVAMHSYGRLISSVFTSAGRATFCPAPE